MTFSVTVMVYVKMQPYRLATVVRDWEFHPPPSAAPMVEERESPLLANGLDIYMVRVSSNGDWIDDLGGDATKKAFYAHLCVIHEGDDELRWLYPMV